MHKKLGLLVMLVGILALSLAFTGCEQETRIDEGNAMPYYFHGTWSATGAGEDFSFDPHTSSYGSCPYRTDISVDQSDMQNVKGTITFRDYGTGDSVGTIKFDGLIPSEAAGSRIFNVVEVTVKAPYYLPNQGETYTLD